MRGGLKVILVAMSMVAWSCGDGHGGAHTRDHESGSHSSIDGDHGLTLNDGKKWVMDDHTRSMLVTMAARVEARPAGTVAAKKLGAALEEDLDALIRGCTMTGAAHAELHKLLVDLIPAIENLALLGGDGELQEAEKQLRSYSDYFE